MSIQPSLHNLLALDKELSSLVHKKRELDRHLAGLESQIYALETGYLEQTMPFSASELLQREGTDMETAENTAPKPVESAEGLGNVVVGWAGYMGIAQGQAVGPKHGGYLDRPGGSSSRVSSNTKLPQSIESSGSGWPDNEYRIFSHSSTTYKKSLSIMRELELGANHAAGVRKKK